MTVRSGGVSTPCISFDSVKGSLFVLVLIICGTSAPEMMPNQVGNSRNRLRKAWEAIFQSLDCIIVRCGMRDVREDVKGVWCATGSASPLDDDGRWGKYTEWDGRIAPHTDCPMRCWVWSKKSGASAHFVPALALALQLSNALHHAYPHTHSRLRQWHLQGLEDRGWQTLWCAVESL
jgi:hypothetical protein